MLSQKLTLQACVVAVAWKHAFSFFAMPTRSGSTKDTQPRVAESPGGIVGNTEPLVERVRSGSTCGSHFPTAKNVSAANTPPTVTSSWRDTPHVKAGRKGKVTFRIKQSFG